MSVTQLPSRSYGELIFTKLVPADLEQRILCVGIIKPGERTIYYNENRKTGIPQVH